MKQFDLNEFLKLKAEGKEPKIVTRNGHNVRILCTDRKKVVLELSFPVVALVKYDEDGEWVTYYTERGMLYKYEESGSDLFFADSNEEPVCPFKPFDRVLVRYDDIDVWKTNFFSHYNSGDILPYVCASNKYAQCIPYEGNEDIVGTSKKPNHETI